MSKKRFVSSMTEVVPRARTQSDRRSVASVALLPVGTDSPSSALLPSVLLRHLPLPVLLAKLLEERPS